MKIAVADQDAEIDPVPTEGGGRMGESEMDRLSNILKSFNEQFGTLFKDTDRVVKRIRDDIAPKVAADVGYQNAKENTPHTERMAHDHALNTVMQALLKTTRMFTSSSLKMKPSSASSAIWSIDRQMPSSGSKVERRGGLHKKDQQFQLLNRSR